jgi:hypothetical protein
MSFQKDPNEIGALWVKTGRKGPYMTGTIEGIGSVVCFATGKEGKAPQWRVLKSVPKDERQNDGGRTTEDDVPW